MVLVFTVGAAARLTRLTTRDTITEPLRNAVLYNRGQRQARRNNEPLPPPTSPRRAHTRLWLHTLITCDWCAGMWIATACTLAAWQWHDTTWYLIAAGALTTAHAVGWLATRENAT